MSRTVWEGCKQRTALLRKDNAACIDASSCSPNPEFVCRQTLIKLERWPDAVEFCDRALHVDGKCVKALSRRASTFVKLAGERNASLVEVNTDAVAGRPASNEIEVVRGGSGGSVDVSSPTAANNANKTISETENGERGTDHEGERCAHFEHCGGRGGLMALALLDLNAAVEADPEGEDVRRQRDSLRQEIEEEKVCL